MTEADWLACTAPEPMLEFLYSRERNERKLRLFVCVCCRRIWHLLHNRSQDFLEVSERYLDGLIDRRELVRASRLHSEFIHDLIPHTSTHIAATIVGGIAETGGAWALAWNAVSEARQVLLLHSSGFDNSVECRAQAALLREIIGNPFSSSIINRAILRWQDAIVPKLAGGLYDELDFDRLPILADALEEAGCTNTDILNHCRQPGEHVRGCWVIDLVLGKE
jgi:hypothetical protein